MIGNIAFPKMRLGFLLVLLIALFGLGNFTSSQALATEADESEPDKSAPDKSAIKIFLDCSSCDDDYLRTELVMASFVRDRKQADIHILITRQRTGSGGREYTIDFIGRGDFAGMQDTLLYHTRESDTDDAIRSGLVQSIKFGLVRYIIRTPQKDKLAVSYLSNGIREKINDKWNTWVFEIGSSMWANGERSSKQYNFSGDVSARRVTEQLRLQLSLWGNYSEERYEFEGETTFNISRRKNVSALSFYSLSNHWSAGVQSEWMTATYSNLKSRAELNVGLEYNYYPYTESTRRQLRFTFYTSMIYVDYEEITTYDKHNEWLFREVLEVTLEMTEPWGEADLSISGSHYFHDASKYRISAFGDLSIRVYEGLSLDLWASSSKIRDQLSLRKGESTLEDILLSRTEQETSYSYNLSVGFSYSFGSIYNNVVNPRFGY